MSEQAVQMRRYKCHKEVYAEKIVGTDLPRRLNLDNGGYVDVTPEWEERNNWQVGGYYVAYADGYASYSPAKAFEEGYTRI